MEQCALAITSFETIPQVNHELSPRPQILLAEAADECLPSSLVFELDDAASGRNALPELWLTHEPFSEILQQLVSLHDFLLLVSVLLVFNNEYLVSLLPI